MKYKVFVVFVVALITIPTAGFSLSDTSAREFIKSYRPNLNDDRVQSVARFVILYSNRYGVEPKVTLSISAVESTFENIQSNICEGTEDKYCEKPENREKSCSYFMMQPSTFYSVMGYWPAGETRTEMCRSLIIDYREAIKAGVKYYANLERRFGRAEAIGTYNAGVESGSENLEYIHKVSGVVGRIEGWND